MLNEQITQKIESTIKKAGSILLSHFRKPLHWHEKKNQGFVTEADLASEKFLIDELGKILPDASFITEEEGKKGNQLADYTWVIDPLDGTTNFAHGLSYFCISVALTYKGKPIFAVIYQPLLDEYFTAQAGKGALLNGVPVAVTKTSYSKSFIAIGVPYAKDARFAEIIHALDIIAPETFGFRHMGAAALDLAYVACGRFDGVVFENLKWWDVAAGILILKEAGAAVTDFSGKEVDEQYVTFCAASDKLHAHLLKVIGQLIKK